MVAFAGDFRGRPDRLVRFTDETSVRSDGPGAIKVPVYATVPGNSDIGWYHDLLAHFPEAPGEVKSSRVLSRFYELSPDVQQRVWNGLADVSVHISDPRPVAQFADDAIAQGIGNKISNAELRHRARQGDPIAGQLIRLRNNYVGQELLTGSVVQRLHDLVERAAHGSAIAPPWDHESVDLMVEDFSSGKASAIRQVAEYTAKGSAAFSDALERAATAASRPDQNRRFWLGPNSDDLVRGGALRELEDGHAFDRGNAKSLRQLESDRKSMVTQLTHTSLYTVSLFEGPEAPPDALIEVDSSDETRVQAADVAAGMAREVYSRESLPGLVKRWHRVYYNGDRVTERNLEATMNLWRR